MFRGAKNASKFSTVENVATFRRYETPQEVWMPEVSQKRKLTDVAFLVAFGVYTVIVLALVIYTSSNSDINRFIHGYDWCGNVCGSKNPVVDGIACSGQDMSGKPYLLDNPLRPTCVEKCNSTGYRCSLEGFDFFPDTLNNIERDSTNLIILCFVVLGLSILALVLFRYFVETFVWTMLIAAIVLFCAITGLFWYFYSQSSDSQASSLLITSIILTILAFVFAVAIFVLRPTIKLLIRFFEEAAKIVFAMPLILLEPFLTFLSNFIVIILFIFTFWLMATSGSLEPQDYIEKYEYVPGTAAVLGLCFSALMVIWMLQFVLACQQMVISGAVASYYFTRDKLAIVSPIYSSFYNLIRFHLGTVAFGSFVITLITIVKILIRATSRQNGCSRLFYVCCFKPLEDLVKYVTSLGYIETAIHGQPLCKSGMRAINLIVSNLLSAIALNSVGNLVFFMVKLCVVCITVGICQLAGCAVFSTVLSAVVALLCIHCFFVVIEIAVDTVFVCYCEDQCINDGDANSYYTTVHLYQQIKTAQAIALKMEQAKRKK